MHMEKITKFKQPHTNLVFYLQPSLRSYHKIKTLQQMTYLLN